MHKTHRSRSAQNFSSFPEINIWFKTTNALEKWFIGYVPRNSPILSSVPIGRVRKRWKGKERADDNSNQIKATISNHRSHCVYIFNYLFFRGANGRSSSKPFASRFKVISISHSLLVALVWNLKLWVLCMCYIEETKRSAL